MLTEGEPNRTIPVEQKGRRRGEDYRRLKLLKWAATGRTDRGSTYRSGGAHLRNHGWVFSSHAHCQRYKYPSPSLFGLKRPLSKGKQETLRCLAFPVLWSNYTCLLEQL
ncbi:unnamed protein product [Citrullus colocynthis]|uniref:Uncharacterized protein n=1 Tax=Citrullus colocynthis TaxID=252529 RepID=A0ABP0XWU2_9ROSI